MNGMRATFTLSVFLLCAALLLSGCERLGKKSGSGGKKKDAAPPTGPGGQLLPVKLSTGVALAQTLPQGTVMSFTVSYRFISGGPQPNVRYVWIIRPTRGDPLRQPVQLKTRGTLNLIAPQVRPNQGPFRTSIERLLPEDGSEPISPSLALR